MQVASRAEEAEKRKEEGDKEKEKWKFREEPEARMAPRWKVSKDGETGAQVDGGEVRKRRSARLLKTRRWGGGG